jgi:hypothetical protein
MDHLRCVFTKQMGLTDKDIVTLSGAHTLVGETLNLIFAPVSSNLVEIDFSPLLAKWFLSLFMISIFTFSLLDHDREDATRTGLDLKEHGLPTRCNLTTHTSSESEFVISSFYCARIYVILVLCGFFSVRSCQLI